MKEGLVLCALLSMLFHNQLKGQFLSREQTESIRKNSKVIYTTYKSSQPHWEQLSPSLKDKRIILLGEFNHGSKEVFELHNSLIKYLHENKGINVLLFESGLGELMLPDWDRDQMTASQMTNGFFGNWRTQEFEELMSYVKSQTISIAGFDVQRTSNSFSLLLERIALQYNVEQNSYFNLEARYGSCAQELVNKKVVYDHVKDSVSNLIKDYQVLLKQVELRNLMGQSTVLLFTKAVIQNRIAYLSYMLQFKKDQDWSKRWAARDSVMAVNVQWLLDTIYKDQSAIIIGHNYHIAKHNDNTAVMGKILHDRYKDNMYSIGFFAGSGSYLDNSGRKIRMLPPDSTALDIKHVIATLTGAVNFINVSTRAAKGMEWLKEQITINDTFIDLRNSNKMTLSKKFDGLILLDTISPPNKN